MSSYQNFKWSNGRKSLGDPAVEWPQDAQWFFKRLNHQIRKTKTLSLPRCIYTSPAYQHQLHQLHRLHQLHQYQAVWLTSTPAQIFNHRYTPSTVYVQVTDQPEKVEDQKICAHHDEPKDIVLRVRMPGQQSTFGSDFWRTKWIDAVRILKKKLFVQGAKMSRIKIPMEPLVISSNFKHL